METFGILKGLSSSLCEMFVFNDNFRPTLDKLKCIDELSISWQDLIRGASLSHTHSSWESWVMYTDFPHSYVMCVSFFPQSVVHEQFFRSKVDCPHFKFSRCILRAHLCAKMENCVLVFGMLPQVLFVLLLHFQAQTNRLHFQWPLTGI